MPPPTEVTTPSDVDAGGLVPSPDLRPRLDVTALVGGSQEGLVPLPVGGSDVDGDDSTVEVVSYSEHLSQAHRLRALRPPTQVFTTSRSNQGVSARTPLVAVLAHPPSRLTEQLVAAQPRLDDRLRVGLGRVATAMGWSQGTQVYLSVVDGRAWLSARPVERADSRSLDAQLRLALHPGPAHALGVGPGCQIQVVAQPQCGRVLLVGLATALAGLLPVLAAESA